MHGSPENSSLVFEIAKFNAGIINFARCKMSSSFNLAKLLFSVWSLNTTTQNSLSTFKSKTTIALKEKQHHDKVNLYYLWKTEFEKKETPNKRIANRDMAEKMLKWGLWNVSDSSTRVTHKKRKSTKREKQQT